MTVKGRIAEGGKRGGRNGILGVQPTPSLIPHQKHLTAGYHKPEAENTGVISSFCKKKATNISSMQKENHLGSRFFNVIQIFCAEHGKLV